MMLIACTPVLNQMGGEEDNSDSSKTLSLSEMSGAIQFGVNGSHFMPSLVEVLSGLRTAVAAHA